MEPQQSSMKKNESSAETKGKLFLIFGEQLGRMNCWPK
jgi:hypothetical protein